MVIGNGHFEEKEEETVKKMTIIAASIVAGLAFGSTAQAGQAPNSTQMPTQLAQITPDPVPRQCQFLHYKDDGRCRYAVFRCPRLKPSPTGRTIWYRKEVLVGCSWNR